MRYTYYPGCSLHSTGLEHGLSIQAVFEHLRLELRELFDWNCCGAASEHIFDHTLALALPARTLALAQSSGHDLVTPCTACYNRLKRADHVMRTDQAVRSRMESLLDFQYTGAVTIRPILSVLYEDVGTEQIAAEVNSPLTGLRVAPYYGCMLVYTPGIAQFDDPDDPQLMPTLLRALGAEVISWSHATDCCGGSLSLGRSDVVQQLVGELAHHASKAGADAIVTACPLCQVNLEMWQTTTPKIPTFYMTELLGLAFGLAEAKAWWRKHLIDPRPVLAKMERIAE